MNQEECDKIWMREALHFAEKGQILGEVPIGAVALLDGKLIAGAHNLREKTNNPLGHAEILLLQKIADKSTSWRFEGVTVYVTCEPCIMCAGALMQARIGRIVYGCKDPKAGAIDSLYNIANDPRLNHKIDVTSGVLEEECATLLKNFFRRLREK
ncbi:MAG: tRNA adenosine(34) deaminase TadA [Pseudomonadota bacterium]